MNLRVRAELGMLKHQEHRLTIQRLEAKNVKLRVQIAKLEAATKPDSAKDAALEEAADIYYKASNEYLTHEDLGNIIRDRKSRAAPESADRVRDAAIEQCAAICDAKFNGRSASGHPREASAARECREEILALKGSTSPSIAAPESAEPSADAQRLDFVLERQAIIFTVPASGIHAQAGYQLMEEEEDEEDYRVISGYGIIYRSKREAIDAARLATSSAAKGEADHG